MRNGKDFQLANCKGQQKRGAGGDFYVEGGDAGDDDVDVIVSVAESHNCRQQRTRGVAVCTVQSFKVCLKTKKRENNVLE